MNGSRNFPVNVAAGGSGNPGSAEVGVADGDGSVGDDSSRGVSHVAFDGAGDGLCVSWMREREEHCCCEEQQRFCDCDPKLHD